LFAFVLIGVSILLADLTIMEHHRMITEMGLAAINLVGVIIAIFVGIGLVSKEIERRTVHTIMARPIRRTQFILGKYLGLVMTLSVNMVVMVAVFFATLWLYRAPVHGVLVQAVALIFVEVALMTAVALFFSTFSTSALSAMMTLGLFVVGHLTTDLRGIAENSRSEWVKAVANAIYYVCPNLEVLNVKGQAAMGMHVSYSYQAMASLYGLLYAALLLAGACVIFQRRDF
jgi:ABC-type transport system involved in multi-copper enzyme maturation permease subunit